MRIESGRLPAGIGIGDMQEPEERGNSPRIVVGTLDGGRIGEELAKYTRVVRQQPPRNLSLPPGERHRLIT